MNGKKLMHLLGLVEMRVPGQRSWEGWALSKKTVGKRLFFLPRKIITFHCDCRYSTISTFIFSFQKIFLRSPRTWLESSSGSQFSPCVGVCEFFGEKKESNWFSFNNILTHLPFEKERGRESHGRRFLNLRNKVSAALAEAPGDVSATLHSPPTVPCPPPLDASGISLLPLLSSCLTYKGGQIFGTC